MYYIPFFRGEPGHHFRVRELAEKQTEPSTKMVRKHYACYCVLVEIEGCSFLLITSAATERKIFLPMCYSLSGLFYIAHFSMILHNSFGFNSCYSCNKIKYEVKPGPYMIRKLKHFTQSSASCKDTRSVGDVVQVY